MQDLHGNIVDVSDRKISRPLRQTLRSGIQYWHFFNMFCLIQAGVTDSCMNVGALSADIPMQDFKEAARLSAEAKSAILEAEKKKELAHQLGKRAASLEAEEQVALLMVQEKQDLVEGASLLVVRGRFQLLQVSFL